MSLLENLSNYYDYMIENEKDLDIELEPFGFTTKKAYIDINLNGDIGFISANLIDEDKYKIIIPATSDSQSRTRGIIAHPLFDTIQYISKNLEEYSTLKNKKPILENKEHYKSYIEELSAFIKSVEEDNDKSYDKEKVLSYLNTIKNYIESGNIIEDLVKEKILYLDENQKLTNKDENNEKIEIEKISSGNFEKALVKFRISDKNNKRGYEIEKDKDLQIAYYNHLKNQKYEKDIDYITGEISTISTKHQKYILNAGSGAKLISSNDTSNFTFKGRFKDDREAFSIGYYTSEKAHMALRYLIKNQASKQKERVFLIFGNENQSIPKIEDNLFDDSDLEIKDITRRNYAEKINSMLNGYRKQEFEREDNINILILDSPVPGRVSVLYYKEININDYLDKLEKWYIDTFWEFKYKGQYYNETPRIKEIIESAYGKKVNESLYKNTYERLFISIVDGRKIPIDIVKKLYQRASNPVVFEYDYEYEKVLSVACSVIRNFYINRKEKEYNYMALEYENKDRSYLYGRLLAVADEVENYAIYIKDAGKKTTNAKRYMSSFSRSPYKIWGIIHNAILPYLDTVALKTNYYNELLEEISSKFNEDDFSNNKALEENYLLSYYSQKYEIRQRIKELSKKNKEEK